MTLPVYPTVNRRVSAPPPLMERNEPVLAREFILATVATVFAVEAGPLMQRTRGRARTAEARQVAMYLAHVACELSLTATGRMFDRDRTTVAYACRRVEDARERPEFNHAIAMMERTVRAIVRTSRALRRDLELAEATLPGGQS